jgi:NADH-quinone oxidoreductase subunit K/multicomponent Na+:H+ antiporter subunit C
MTLQGLFLTNAAALILVGLFGILTRKNIIKILLAINIMQTGVNLLLVGVGWLEEGVAPILEPGLGITSRFVDPLPQAMVLTAIVIAFGTTALGLTVAVNYIRSHGSMDTTSLMGRFTEKEEDEVVR